MLAYNDPIVYRLQAKMAFSAAIPREPAAVFQGEREKNHDNSNSDAFRLPQNQTLPESIVDL